MWGRDKIFLKEPKGQNYVTICFKMRFTYIYKKTVEIITSVYTYFNQSLYTLSTSLINKKKDDKWTTTSSSPLLRVWFVFFVVVGTLRGGEF